MSFDSRERIDSPVELIRFANRPALMSTSDYMSIVCHHRKWMLCLRSSDLDNINNKERVYLVTYLLYSPVSSNFFFRLHATTYIEIKFVEWTLRNSNDVVNNGSGRIVKNSANHFTRFEEHGILLHGTWRCLGQWRWLNCSWILMRCDREIQFVEWTFRNGNVVVIANSLPAQYISCTRVYKLQFFVDL